MSEIIIAPNPNSLPLGTTTSSPKFKMSQVLPKEKLSKNVLHRGKLSQTHQSFDQAAVRQQRYNQI
jgi:hypothetical protein